MFSSNLAYFFKMQPLQLHATEDWQGTYNHKTDHGKEEILDFTQIFMLHLFDSWQNG